MSEAGIEKVAVTLNEKPLALNWDTGKVAWRQDPTSKAQTPKNANSGVSLDWEIGWKSFLLKNNHLEKFSQVLLPRHIEATKALALCRQDYILTEQDNVATLSTWFCRHAKSKIYGVIEACTKVPERLCGQVTCSKTRVPARRLRNSCVKVKMQWRPQNAGDARIVGCLLRLLAQTGTCLGKRPHALQAVELKRRSAQACWSHNDAKINPSSWTWSYRVVACPVVGSVCPAWFSPNLSLLSCHSSCHFTLHHYMLEIPLVLQGPTVKRPPWALGTDSGLRVRMGKTLGLLGDKPNAFCIFRWP